jgi:hypothetical protein
LSPHPTPPTHKHTQRPGDGDLSNFIPLLIGFPEPSLHFVNNSYLIGLFEALTEYAKLGNLQRMGIYFVTILGI